MEINRLLIVLTLGLGLTLALLASIGRAAPAPPDPTLVAPRGLPNPLFAPRWDSPSPMPANELRAEGPSRPKADCQPIALADVGKNPPNKTESLSR